MKKLMLSSIFLFGLGLAGCGGSAQGGNPGGGVAPQSATHFSVSAAATATSGTPVNFTVTALDSTNETASSYSGIVHFSSSDPQAALPSNSPLMNGSGGFSATLETAGNQIISATDSASASIRGSSATIDVIAVGAITITSGAPTSGTVGKNYDIRCEQIPPCNVFTAGFPLTAMGGTQPYSWSWVAAQGSSLPPGLAITGKCLNLTGPSICGKPSEAGSFDVVVTATDSASPAASTSANYTIDIRAAAEANAAAKLSQDSPQQHHHYKLIDLGTFGGPASYVNFNTDVLNDRGIVVGSSQTASTQPPTSNGFACPGGNVYQAFEWNNGAVSDLGALSDGNCSNAIWINTRGEIAGNAENGRVDPLTGVNEIHAVVWKNGQIHDLGTLGGNQSGAQAINDRGDVAGFAINEIPDSYSLFDLVFLGSPSGTQTRAVVWRDGAAHDLQTLGGPDAIAWFVNQVGQVAGVSYINSIPDSVTGIPPVHLFVWSSGEMKDLGSLGGAGLPSVSGFNNRGQVIGSSPLLGDQTSDPFLWDGGRLIDMAVEGDGGQFTDANVINDAGEVAGAAIFPNGLSQAAVWRDAAVMDLGAVGSDCFSEAWSISSAGQVGGTSVSCDGNTWRAFLWENGEIVDLRSLVSSGPDLQLVYTIGINDRGEIAGTGVPAGLSTALDQDTNSHAFVLIPCDENHPNIEGCDYNIVDASAAPEARPAATAGEARVSPIAAMTNRYRRFRALPRP